VSVRTPRAQPEGKVLVLGRDTRSFLSVVRSLGRHGVEVHVGWCPSDAPAARSRFIAGRHALPPPAPVDAEAWQAEFERLLLRERFDLVIPTNDPAIIPLQHQRRRFEPLARFALPADEALETALDKIRTHELAASLGVRVPRSVTVRAIDEIDAALEQFTYPVIVKPRRSYLPEDLVERGHVRRARTAAEARSAAEGALIRGSVLIQEHVDGVGCGYELLADRGEILMRFQHERVHEPPGGGWSSYRRSTRVSPEFEDAASRLVGALSYTGVAMVEFKRDPGSGRWALMEINPRFWGSLPLALASGVDFPVALWDLLVDGRRPSTRRYPTDVYARNVRSDLKWLWSNARTSSSDPALAARSLRSVVTEGKNVVRGRERSDTFVADDLTPALTELGHLAARAAEPVRAALTRRRRPPPELPRMAISEAQCVLFVCRGNICRSPFAARYAERVLGAQRRIASAGLLDAPDRPSPLAARAVAAEYGVDLADHRSVVLTEALVAEAGVVLVFDEENRRGVLRRFPSAGGRVFLLGDLDGGPAAIPDPLDRGQAFYRRVYARIAGLLETVAPEGAASATPPASQNGQPVTSTRSAVT
jgi:protein-tyrosine-phosphatase/predicted ATP-grasp superfamily ATP-dependent carboligase